MKRDSLIYFNMDFVHRTPDRPGKRKFGTEARFTATLLLMHAFRPILLLFIHTIKKFVRTEKEYGIILQPKIFERKEIGTHHNKSSINCHRTDQGCDE
ncbi:hypothetical protein AVEN_133738-1 [Araneus ventricosus]|uniref:Uncharacterized protein n=1 Tax=Araneus ventricosus TaxID=182803 RepID=A0A4Y2B7B1_ARAVE|nr:hypothetical protein AVEN_133738-1 [Araneus ventricosus]